MAPMRTPLMTELGLSAPAPKRPRGMTADAARTAVPPRNALRVVRLSMMFCVMFLPCPLARRRQVEAVQIHHLAPRGRKVTPERLPPVPAGIAFRDGAELRVRTEDEIDGGAGPLDLTGPAVTPFVDVLA